MQGNKSSASIAHDVMQNAMQKIARRGQLRMVMVALTIALATLVTIAPHARAQSPDTKPCGPNTSLAIVMYVGARCDTENIMDEAFEIASSAPPTVTTLRPTALQSGIKAVAPSGEIVSQTITLTAASVQMGLPDGMRASGIYSIDGGYGLAEPIYADLLATLLGD